MKKVNNIYYLGIILLTVKMWFFITHLFEVSSFVENIFTLSITILFGLKIFFTRSSYKEFAIISIVGIFIYITSQRIMNIDLFLSVLSILAAKDVNLKKVIKYELIINSIFIVIHIFYFIGCYFFEPGKIEYMIDDDSIRYTFFMRHPNYLGATLLWTISAYIYLHFDDKKNTNLFLIIVTAIFVYFSCKSKTTFITFIILFILVIRKNKMKMPRFAKNVNIIFLISIFASIYIATNYYNFTGQAKVVADSLNKTLSGRVKFSAIGIKEYGSTLLGRYINTGDERVLNYYGIKKLIIDSFYISCYINYGIFYLIAIEIGLLKLRKKAGEKEFIFLLIFIIVSLTERYVIYSTLVFPLLFFADLYNEKRKEKSS